MKRSPLKRKTPLRSRGNTKYRRRERDLPHMQTVRKLPCIVTRICIHMPPKLIGELIRLEWSTSCYGRVEADHMGQRALGHKADDKTTVPMCSHHHRQRTDMSGMFRTWDKHQMRAFCDWAIADTQLEVYKLTKQEASHG